MYRRRLRNLACLLAILIAWTNVASAWHSHDDTPAGPGETAHSVLVDHQTPHEHHSSDHCCHASAHMVALPRINNPSFTHPSDHWLHSKKPTAISLTSPPETPPPIA